MPPQPEVVSGDFTQANFMADLQSVYLETATAAEYGHPQSFFQRTYITPSMKTLMQNCLSRWHGKGGHPVIQTKTGFGGGKTHTLIALLHLARNINQSITPELDAIIKQDANTNPDPIAVSVIDGAYLSTSDTNTTPNGSPLNTLWSVMAYQLDCQEGYDTVVHPQQPEIAPAGQLLDQLLRQSGPSLILIDELVAYVRNCTENQQGNIYSFIQSLTQSAMRNPTTALVVTLPEGREATGGPAGAAVLTNLENILGRNELVWKPLSIDESFTVVRQRLFGPEINQTERERTALAFSRMYANAAKEYPASAKEQRYFQRMVDTYPFHPEIFDRLYQDWSANPSLQRTRGVLRLTAATVRALYREGHAAPLILPADLPLTDHDLSNEFEKLLSEQWGPVMSEADAADGRAGLIDLNTGRYQEVGGAARRVSRAVFLGSSPNTAAPGLETKAIMLGSALPGQGVSRYKEALHSMQQQLHFLYQDGPRYYFHTEPNLNQVVADRSGSIDPDQVNQSITERLQAAIKGKSNVMIAPEDSLDLNETENVRLLVLPPQYPFDALSRNPDDAASRQADQLLKTRGHANRINRNTLLFMPPSKDQLRVLRKETEELLAWQSLTQPSSDGKLLPLPNLTPEQQQQIRQNIQETEARRTVAMVRTYSYTMAPQQPDPTDGHRIDYPIHRTNAQQGEAPGDIAASAMNALRKSDELVDRIHPQFLVPILQQYWDETRPHVSIRELQTAMLSQVHLFRLSSPNVLYEALAQGIREGHFGYAESYDGTNYHPRRIIREAMPDYPTEGLLIEPTVAEQQKQQEPTPAPAAAESNNAEETAPSTGDPSPSTGEPEPPPPPQSVAITLSLNNTDAAGYDFNTLSQEIIKRLDTVSDTLELTVTVNGNRIQGYSENEIRALSENCRLLGLTLKTDAN